MIGRDPRSPAVWPWLQKPPPASPAYDAPGLAPGPRFGPFIGHSHVYQPQPFPGAPAYAYEGLGLVEFSPIGPATINRNHLWPLQPPAAFAGWSLHTTGLGGLVQGQVIGQPLIVTGTSVSEPLTTDGFFNPLDPTTPAFAYPGFVGGLSTGGYYSLGGGIDGGNVG